NIFGNVMHRSFEILVKKLRRKESYDVLHIVRQSMMENYMDIAGRYKPETLDTVLKQYEEYLQNRLSAFLADRELMAEVMSDDAEVYTEVPFSLYATQDEILAADRSLETVLQNRFPLEKGGKYWINGKADLVIVTADRKVHIVDYKSDHIGSETMERFHEHLSGTYDNQQELYRFTLSKMFGIPVSDISYRYYHMYMEREA
nr:PD-(D/E)XK nuclease family protein [Eubacterium sp.]